MVCTPAGVDQRAFVVALLCASLAAAAPAAPAAPEGTLPGPYAVREIHYNVSTLDKTDPHLVVLYPVAKYAGQTFPLLSYAHGAAGGGWYTFAGYYALWEQMASYGFVIVAPKSCSMGCRGGGWERYYLEQIKAIEFARAQAAKGDPVFLNVDFRPEVGIGVVGHSMGGQATVRSAQAGLTASHNIRAAVLHHPFWSKSDKGPATIAVPLAAFTGTTDHICPANETMEIWNPAPAPKTLRNQIGANHLEPILLPPVEDPRLAKYTAAWFSAYLLNDTSAAALFYGNGSDSLCNSAPMEECISTVPSGSRWKF